LKRTTILLFIAALWLAACGGTAPPPPVVTPEGADRFLIDPRTGSSPLPPAVESKFEAAYRFALAGNESEAARRIAEIRQRSGNFESLDLLEALIDIRAGRNEIARQKIGRVQQHDPENLVARVYEAELALRERETRIAYDLYRQIAALPNAPATATERLRDLEGTLFNELYAAAQSAPDAEAIRLLREALAFNPGAVEPRVLLAQKLIAQRSFDDARRELEPLLNTAADRPDVQEILAEVDVGRGRYQEAIVRYDRLARRTREPRYEHRLEQIKAEWSAANMPAHYRAALDSEAVTRNDFAILLYWTVPSVRFAQNLSSPSIAVDIEDVSGREEIIRAIALGLYDVDPVTRRVSPYRTVPASRLSSYLGRVLTLRGAQCAKGTPSVLAACSVEDPLATFAPDAAVPGRDVVRYLEQVAKKL
jgi:thioredoxin-like negative regulator of GroEL